MEWGPRVGVYPLDGLQNKETRLVHSWMLGHSTLIFGSNEELLQITLNTPIELLVGIIRSYKLSPFNNGSANV